MLKGNLVAHTFTALLIVSLTLMLSACEDDKRAAITHKWKIPAEDFSLNINKDSSFSGTEHNHMMQGKWAISKDGSSLIIINADKGRHRFKIKELNDKELILFDEREKEDLKFVRND